MSIEDDIAFLERVPTLGLLGREALRILAISAESRSLHSGNVLFRDGEVADAGYVIQEGSFSLAPERPGGIDRRPLLGVSMFTICRIRCSRAGGRPCNAQCGAYRQDQAPRPRRIRSLGGLRTPRP